VGVKGAPPACWAAWVRGGTLARLGLQLKARVFFISARERLRSRAAGGKRENGAPTVMPRSDDPSCLIQFAGRA
jgi:hypothetical protein